MTASTRARTLPGALSAWALACVALQGCSAGGGPVGHPDASAVVASEQAPEASPPPAVTEVSAEKAATPPAENPSHAWREAMRLQRWGEAFEQLMKLPDHERSTAPMRLALGVAALHAGHHDIAVEALDGLDEKLPLVRDEIRGWFARAAAFAGPFDRAAEILASSGDTAGAIAAAEAYLRGDDSKKARATIDAAVRRARRTANELPARRARAAIAEKAGHKATAIADLRWLIREHPRDARDALDALERLGGSVPIDERIAVLVESATPGNIDATLTALDAIAEARSSHKVTVAFARGKALYRARDYARALAELDAVAARMPAAHAGEARYYAARAAARSGHEDDAAKRFHALASRLGTSLWGERGAYRHAETLLTLGRYGEAAKAYAQYLARFRRSSHRSSAEYGRALALLGSGDSRRARTLLSGLKKHERNARARAALQQLEGIAALRSGDRDGAVVLWTALVNEQPLTYPALAAHARLRAIEHTPLPPLMPEPPESPESPVQPLALTLPEAPALLGSLGLEAAAEGRLSLMEGEAVAAYPGRESEALCELYGRFAPARRRHQIGSRAVSHALLMRPPGDDARWAWSCVYPTAYGDIVRREETHRQLPPGLIHAVMRQESAFAPNAVSMVGARGLMQLMPYTARRIAAEMGHDDEPGIPESLDATTVVRPDVNIRFGAFYLAKLLRTFRGSVPLAVASYNAGPQAVGSWLGPAVERDADLWIARIPYRETRHYVDRVLTNLARYQWLAGGDAAVMELDLALPDKVDIGPSDY